MTNPTRRLQTRKASLQTRRACWTQKKNNRTQRVSFVQCSPKHSVRPQRIPNVWNICIPCEITNLSLAEDFEVSVCTWWSLRTTWRRSRSIPYARADETRFGRSCWVIVGFFEVFKIEFSLLEPTLSRLVASVHVSLQYATRLLVR